MLSHLKRYITGNTPQTGQSPQPAQAETQKEDVTMDKTNGVDTTAQTTAVIAEAVDNTVSLQATVATLTEQLVASHAEVAELKDLVAQATAFQENQVKLTAEAKVATRLSQLTAVLGDGPAATMNASLASLSDEAFGGVLSSLGTKLQTEAATPLFQEVGVDGEVDATKLADESSGVMDYLTAKYTTAK